MKIEKPRLRKSGGEVRADGGAPSLEMPGVADIVERREESWGEIIAGYIRSSLTFLLFAILIIVVVYGALAATVIFLGQVGNRHVLVARNTFVGGTPTLNSEVYVSTTPDDGSPLSHLKTGFLGADNASIYRIVSGPYDKVTHVNGKVYVNDKLVGSDDIRAAANEVTLSNQLLGLCVSGACTENKTQWQVLSPSYIYGEIKRG